MRATFHNYGRMLYHTQYAECTFKMMYCVLHALQQLRFWIHVMTVSMLNTALFQCLKRQDQRISKTCKTTFIFCSSWNLWKGAHFLHIACQGGRRAPLHPVSYAAARSRKVPPPKPRVKAKSSLSGRNYFITMHHQAGINLKISLK